MILIDMVVVYWTEARWDGMGWMDVHMLCMPEL